MIFDLGFYSGFPICFAYGGFVLSMDFVRFLLFHLLYQNIIFFSSLSPAVFLFRIFFGLTNVQHLSVGNLNAYVLKFAFFFFFLLRVVCTKAICRFPVP